MESCFWPATGRCALDLEGYLTRTIIGPTSTANAIYALATKDADAIAQRLDKAPEINPARVCLAAYQQCDYGTVGTCRWAELPASIVFQLKLFSLTTITISLNPSSAQGGPER